MLALMGAEIRVEPHDQPGRNRSGHPRARERAAGIRVPEHLVPLSIDEFPVFFIAAAAARGETLVTGASELRVKESDRLAVMAAGLGQLGIECELLADGIRIQGGAMGGGRIDSHGDHRIAMAFAVASLAARDTIEIDDVANVATSFRDFRHWLRLRAWILRRAHERGAPVERARGDHRWPSGSGKGTVSRSLAGRCGCICSTAVRSIA